MFVINSKSSNPDQSIILVLYLPISEVIEPWRLLLYKARKVSLLIQPAMREIFPNFV